MPAAYTPNERRILIFASVGHFITHFFELIYPTLAVALAADTGIGLDRVLGWSAVAYLLFGLGALPAGYLADRFGSRSVLLASLAGTGLAALAAGVSSPGPPLALALAALGLAGSLHHPAGMSLISRGIRARGRALGVNGVAGGLGVALTPFCTATLTALVGWRGTYLVTGVVVLAATLFFRRLSLSEPMGDHGDVVSVHADGSRTILFPLLCLATMLAGISYRGNTIAQPAYFAARVSMLGYGTVTTLVYLIGVAGQYAGGRLADRHDLRYLYLGAHAASLPALLLMAWLTELPLVGAASMFVLFSLGMQPIENSLFARFTPPRLRGTGYGIKFALTFGVGALGVRLAQAAEASGDLSLAFLWLGGVVGLTVVTITLFIAASGSAAMRNRVPRPDDGGVDGGTSNDNARSLNGSLAGLESGPGLDSCDRR